MIAATARAKENRRSDNGRVQILCETLDSQSNLQLNPVESRVLAVEERYENGTRSILVSQGAAPKVSFRDMSERILRYVTARQPKAFQPHPEEQPSYLIAYVEETLECGHKLKFHFLSEAEPLIAKRRVCCECASLPQKKQPHSVKNPGSGWRRLLAKEAV